MTANINIRIDNEAKTQLQSIAEKECRTLTQMVKFLILRFLEENRQTPDVHLHTHGVREGQNIQPVG